MPKSSSQRIRVIDSHTAGEPTRVVVDAEEPLGITMKEKRSAFARDFDKIRTAVVCEPRGHDALVGALLCEPCEPDCVAGVVFFNNVGVLHGCLHGTMGLAVTLQHMGKIGAGRHRIDTPTGVVTVELEDDGATVSITNIRSYRFLHDVEVAVPEYGTVSGDVAWGGNWFFLTQALPEHPVTFGRIEELTAFAWQIRQALERGGITGAGGEVIDHVEIFGPPSNANLADSKNFVLCPGKAYDRSPCGTGTSAKLACLAAEDALRPNQVWRQAGILDSVFSGRVEFAEEGGIYPTVTGHAYMTGESHLIIDPADPFSFGISS